MYIHPLYHWPGKGLWMQSPSAARRWTDFSTYVHFPYCRNICEFCGYETRLITRSGAREFTELVCEEVARHHRTSDFRGTRLRSVFFGGGTASLIVPPAIMQILEAIQTLPAEASLSEVTLECEPGTISRDRLRAMKEAGVNRVSVCAQALDDGELQRIGRKHLTRDSLRLIDDCIAVGIDNIHMDLMYGLPEQSLAHWERTLGRLEGLPLTHLSAYKLYVYRHGALHRQRLAPLPAAESDTETNLLRRMHDAVREITAPTGFKQYSLTEYARDSWQSVYILDTFNGRDILPIGPSAFGRCGDELYENSPYVHLYGSAQSSEFDRAYHMAPLEAFKRDAILNLWLLHAPLDTLAARHGVQIGERLRSSLAKLERQDRLSLDGDRVQIESRHRFAVGAVMAELADLELSDWGEGASPISPPAALTDCAEAIPTISPGMNSVLRTARRDPDFFRALCADPQSTLNGLGSGLDLSEIAQLCAAIANTPHTEVTPLQQVWRRVAAEHPTVRS